MSLQMLKHSQACEAGIKEDRDCADAQQKLGSRIMIKRAYKHVLF